MTEPEQAAFPVPDNWVGLGLSKRELAAIAIGASLIGRPFVDFEFPANLIAKRAIAIADELLTQLEATNDETTS
jgi:hypothetical protein